jgi:foldase protein PrsA
MLLKSFLKKSSIGILSLCVFLGSTFYSNGEEGRIYKDIQGHWAYNQIMGLIDKGVVNGVQKENNEFYIYPDKEITRSEFITLLVKSKNLEKIAGQEIDFNDVANDSWYKVFIDIATSNKLIKGYPDGTFRPEASITRAEVATLISNADMWELIDDGSMRAFTDVKEDHWAYKYIMVNSQREIIRGYSDGTFRLNNFATRAESFVVLTNYLSKTEVSFDEKEWSSFLQTTMSKIEGMLNMTDEEVKKNFWEENLPLARRDALEQLKIFKINYVRAVQANITLSEDELAEIDGVVEMAEIQYGSKEEADKVFMKQVGVSIEDYRILLEKILLSSKYVKVEMDNYTIPESDMLEYYNENKDSIDKTSVRHILFGTKNPTTFEPLDEEEILLAKNKAEDTLEKIRNNEDMEALAIELSEDPGVQHNQGVYEVVYNSNFVPEFEAWALNNELGETGIIETTFGYHVMKVESRSDFESEKGNIAKALKEEAFVKNFQQYRREYRFRILPSMR